MCSETDDPWHLVCLQNRLLPKWLLPKRDHPPGSGWPERVVDPCHACRNGYLTSG